MLLAGCSTTISGANTPPAGTIWFGQSFDPNTFEIRGKTDTVKASVPFAAVAGIGRTVAGDQMNMRVYLDGMLVSTQGLSWTGSGSVWGWSLGPLYQSGSWRYELTDVGGNVLAGGQVEATD